jgi:hypothetical protein
LHPLIADAAGYVTAAARQWLVENGRIQEDAQILHLDVRTWRALVR